jgi:hypothetical protein
MAVEIISGLKVCDDCTIAIANDDYSGMDDATEVKVREGIELLSKRGWPVIGDETDEFSWDRCDCCNGLPGRRHECSLLGN